MVVWSSGFVFVQNHVMNRLINIKLVKHNINDANIELYCRVDGVILPH